MPFTTPEPESAYELDLAGVIGDPAICVVDLHHPGVVHPAHIAVRGCIPLAPGLLVYDEGADVPEGGVVPNR